MANSDFDNEDDGLSKICSRCNIKMDYANFNADSRLKNGLRSACKDCDAIMKKKIRDNNITKYRAANRLNNKLYREKKRNKE